MYSWRIKKPNPPQRSGTAHLPQETWEVLNHKIFSSSSDRLYIKSTKSKLIHTTHVSWQKGSWVTQNILHSSSGQTASLIYQSVLSGELLNPLQDDASLNSPAQHSPCPTDFPVRKHSLFSFGSLLPVRHPMITLNNSSPSAHVSSQVPGSSIPPGRLYIACSWGLSSEVVLSHPFIIFSPLWTSCHLFISLYSPNDKSNPHK